MYDGTNIEAQFGSDGLCDKYVYTDGLDIRSVSSSVNYAYISDTLGSTRFVLKNGMHDAAHTTYSVVTYTPFGTAYDASGSDTIIVRRSDH